jgi:hypothetical protein
MKLLHVKQARAVWLFDVNDLNPKGEAFVDELIDFIKERYSFATVPDYKDVAQKAGTPQATSLRFQRGQFHSDSGPLEIVFLEVHSDGVVVETIASTEESEHILADLLVSAAETFELAYDPTIVRSRLYISSVIVSMNIDWAKVNPALTTFAENASRALDSGTVRQFRPAGLQFWTDPNDAGTHRTFTLVPQIGRALSEQRYFSEAPLRTEDHLRLLGELAGFLSQ